MRMNNCIEMKMGEPPQAQENLPVILNLLSGKSGQGSSILSLYSASVVSRHHRTLLVDLDPCSTHRYFLEDHDFPGIANLIMVREGHSSLKPADFIRNHPCGFDLLGGPRSNDEWAFLSGIDLHGLVADISSEYEVVVMDISSNRLSNVLALTAASSLNLLVIRPDLLSARSALRLLEGLNRFTGIESAGVAVIANCSPPSPLLRPQPLASALELPLLAVLPYDPVVGEDFASFSTTIHTDSPFFGAVRCIASALGLIAPLTDQRRRKRTMRNLFSMIAGGGNVSLKRESVKGREGERLSWSG